MKCASSSQHSDYGRRQLLLYEPRASSLNLKTEDCCTASPDTSVRLFCVSVPLLPVDKVRLLTDTKKVFGLWLPPMDISYQPRIRCPAVEVSYWLLPAFDLHPNFSSSLHVTPQRVYASFYQSLLPLSGGTSQSIFGMLCISFETPPHRRIRGFGRNSCLYNKCLLSMTLCDDQRSRPQIGLPVPHVRVAFRPLMFMSKFDRSTQDVGTKVDSNAVEVMSLRSAAC